MLYLYDQAIKNKLQKMYPRVIYSPVDKFFQNYLLNNNNEKQSQTILPALSIWRISHEFNAFSARANMNTSSMDLRGRGRDGMIRQVFSMQIPLTYQLDIWASTDVDRDDLFTELMYALTLYPYLSINYQGVNISFSICIESSDDLTEISEFQSTGDLYRMSIPLRVPDARLFFYKDVNELKHLSIQYSVEDDLNKDISNLVPNNK